ncbi:uncharacterized protein KQ657_000741 [Scheffersomyces spartinae]|uniref:Uncharacterized protein n=1 Tax=Scheffersomyces spartinae TaxID=45513 RepID=A0A9P7V943_9ASCO|nr:uncharacterized protein KQ657_000741 [Scheffersomyces spartinae]KAG7193325.1 hypothetical protein KQ657_000741 [Scheffersomyces spartinae]
MGLLFMAVKRKAGPTASTTSVGSVGSLEHPALSLSNIFNNEEITQLQKLHPIHLPNTSDTSINRNGTDYVYVINWLYQCRGFVKLQSEYFDVDLFEMELLDSSHSSDINVFSNRLRLNLISTLQSSKLSSLANFEAIFRLWFGIDTPLGGIDEEDENDINGGDVNVVKVDTGTGPLPTFNSLNINDKFTILAIIMRYISDYLAFRTFIDKSGLSVEQLRITPFFIHTSAPGTVEEYYHLFDNTRLYKRTIKHSPVTIPRKRSETKGSSTYNFDVVSIAFELFYNDIYEFNEYYKNNVVKSKTKLARAIGSQLKSHLDQMFQLELKKRKVLAARRKELQMATLLATRKRSSRLEAKEMKRQEEEDERLKLQEEELKIAGLRRLEKRRLLQEKLEQEKVQNSREHRLKLRQAQSTQQTPEPEVGPEVEPEVEPEAEPKVEIAAEPVESNDSTATELHPIEPQSHVIHSGYPLMSNGEMSYHS